MFDTKWCVSLQVRSDLSVFPPSETVLVPDFTSHLVATAGLSLDFSKLQLVNGFPLERAAGGRTGALPFTSVFAFLGMRRAE